MAAREPQIAPPNPVMPERGAIDLIKALTRAGSGAAGREALSYRAGAPRIASRGSTNAMNSVHGSSDRQIALCGLRAGP